MQSPSTAIRSCALPVVLFALTAAATGQVDWIQHKNLVPARWNHALAYDGTRGRVVLFGGYDLFIPRSYNDTWEWDGTSWIQRFPQTLPAPRSNHAMTFDEARGRVVLFSGCPSSMPYCAPGLGFRDTWEWDGTIWTRRATQHRPPDRREHALAYDAARRRVVLYGGHFMSDTWEYDGTDWTQRFPANSPGAGSGRGRWSHAMAYDRARGRVVLFGGENGFSSFADTWEWDGSDWTQRTPSVQPPVSPGRAMVYDDARGRIVLTTGPCCVGQPMQTWEWDGTVWTRLTPLRSPVSRYEHYMAYDRARERTVMFGGSNVVSLLSETWELYTTRPARYVPFGVGCPGSAGTPSIFSASLTRPWIGDAFQVEIRNLPPGNATAIAFGASRTQWGATPLPFNLSPIGMLGCTLYLSLDLLVPAANPAGIASLTVQIPNVPSLAGHSFYNQGFTADPGATALGVIASNAGHALVGAR